MRCQLVNAPHCGKLKVYVQGEGRAGKVGFLTVHDVGYNHKAYAPFVETKAMNEVANKTIWIHVCLPGQDDNSEDLPESFQFPSMDEIAEDLHFLLNEHAVGSVMGFGEGAGANILCRFALKFPNRCSGLILINCNSSSTVKNSHMHIKIKNAKEGGGKFLKKLLSFTHTSHAETHTGNIEPALNHRNVMKYWHSYVKRSDITGLLKTDLKINILLVTGQFSKHLESVRQMNNANVALQLIVVLDSAENPLTDSSTALARALILFCKSCGVLLDVPMMGLEKEFMRVKERKPPTMAQIQLSQKVQRYESLLKDEQQSH